jgi:peroxiredoxin
MIVEGSKVPEVTLLDTDGHEVALADLTHGAPSVFFFLRHYA